ncbi:MAG TPA: glucose-6-phosphate isomerase [Planctomycetaceae bacterium]|nr:glucose-6-phosphate isomerase [Planctomycetaceae bacterium]
MDRTLRYDPSAARQRLEPELWERVEPQLLAARQDVIADVVLWNSGGPVPESKQPLDAGFIELPMRLLDDCRQRGPLSLAGRIETVAARLREAVDRFVVLGIGGSYMGARALFEALCHRYHNELPRDRRSGVPRVYFEGNNLDNDTLSDLLALLADSDRRTDFQSVRPGDDAAAGRTGSPSCGVEDRWAMAVISKSGGTLETAAAFRLLRRALEAECGPDSDEVRQRIVPVTGETGRLRDLAVARGYSDVFPIPDGVGGRFSVLTAVGLLPAAVMGLDVVALLQGAADMTERFANDPFGDNPVLDYVAVCHLFEKHHGMKIRLFSTWGARLEALGLWYDQLLSESLGKQERGATPITVVNTRDLHSRGQQHQEGRRDKLITNVFVQSPSRAPLALPAFDSDEDRLNQHAGKTLPQFLSAAFEGTNRAYAADRRPTADIVLPKLDEYALGQLFQMLMLATVVEGRLIGVNPYGQPGVEAYKRNMTEILSQA